MQAPGRGYREKYGVPKTGVIFDQNYGNENGEDDETAGHRDVIAGGKHGFSGGF
jgi:hypothetical protein